VIPIDRKPEYFYPVLPFAQFNASVGQFLDPKYYELVRDAQGRGQVHPGQDLNGNIPAGGNADSDLGKPVHAVTNGRVVHSLEHRVWGNIVLIRHAGPRVWTQYAHLDTMTVIEGDQVVAGEVIGTIGKGGRSKQFPRGRFPAHLHFEVRTQDVPADEWPSLFLLRRAAEVYCRKTRVDPMRWLAKVGARAVLK
jgi:murein DD-endopeptidase MepM/ murein hydrolase activator NlpD